MPSNLSADATRTETQLKHPEDHSSDVEDNDIPEQRLSINRSDEGNDKEEDPATQAASENLRQTTISDREPTDNIDTSVMSDVDHTSANREDVPAEGRTTPEALATTDDAQDEEMKERVSSPKKKRGREQDDEPRDPEAADNVEEGGSSPNGAAVNGGRTTRSAPEKKRHRDESVDTIVVPQPMLDAKATISNEPTDDDTTTISDHDLSTSSSEPTSKPVTSSNLKDIPQTSPSAFAASAFGSLAGSTTSGFAALAASKPVVFGGGTKPPLSGFGSSSGAPSVIPETSAIKSGFGSSVSTTSPPSLSSGFSSPNSGFSALGSGSKFGGGFGGGFGGFNVGSGAKLSSFAAASAPSGEKQSKAPKAFGAPESDEDEDEDEEDDEKGDDQTSDNESVSVDEKKKAKFSKVALDDGEKDEVTLIQFRTKLFVMSSELKAWKERGSGTIKLNVPKDFVDMDEFEVPIPGTYDSSARETSDVDKHPGPPLARLIMRQEGTNKVILNSPIIKAVKFEQNSNRIMFTAFEDGHPLNVLLRMTKVGDVNSFLAEIKCIQNEL